MPPRRRGASRKVRPYNSLGSAEKTFLKVASPVNSALHKAGSAVGKGYVNASLKIGDATGLTKLMEWDMKRRSKKSPGRYRRGASKKK